MAVTATITLYVFFYKFDYLKLLILFLSQASLDQGRLFVVRFFVKDS